MLTLSVINKYYKWLDYIMPVFFVVALIEFYFGIWRLTTIVKFFSIIVTLIIVFKLYNVNNTNGGMKSVLTLFILYNVITGVLYVVNERPITCYFNDLMNYIPAMLYMYAGMFDNRNNQSYYKLFLVFCSISMVIGLILYTVAPSWYVSRSVEVYNSQWFANEQYNEESYLGILRFTSYLTSEYAVIYLGMAAYCASLFFLYCKNSKLSNRQRFFCIISVIILLISFFLSQMRVAMVFSVLLLLFYFFRSIKRGNVQITNRIIAFTLIIVSVALVFITARLGDRIDALQEMVSNRIHEISLKEVAYGRDTQVSSLMATWNHIVFGHGLGSGGSIAVSYGFPGVTDVQYIKILFETGIFGFIFFIFIILSTVIRSIKYLKYYLLEASLIGFIMLAMTGGNTLSLGYLYILPFWYAMGKVWNTSYLQYVKNNKIYA